MKLSERVKELQWIFTRIILWYKKQPKSTRKRFINSLDIWMDKMIDLYDFNPREKE